MTNEQIIKMLSGIIDNGEVWEYRWHTADGWSDWKEYKLGYRIFDDYEYRKVNKKVTDEEATSFVNNPVPTIQEEVIALRLENEKLKVKLNGILDICNIPEFRISDLQKENEDLKTQIEKLKAQIEKMKNKLNCSKYHYCLCKDKTCKDCKDWKMDN